MSRSLCLLISLVFVLSSVVQGADPDLVGWWWFDEGGGTTAGDSSGYGNNGTLTGGAGWGAGYFRTALQLDGVDGYVDVPHNETLLTDDEATVMAWINTPRLETTSGGGYQGIISKGNGTARSYSLYTTPTAMHFSTGPSGTYIGSTSTGGALPTNEWVHVCGMIIDGGHAYFVNGEPAGTFSNGAVGPGAADTENVVIGRTQEGTGRSFLGLIDDVRIYVRGLTQDEIKAIMTGEDLGTNNASNPIPGEGQTDVQRDIVLSWTTGDSAATHDVYLGTNLDDVNSATRADSMGLLVSQGQTATTYDPEGLLEIGQTYYWRIDEVNAAPDNTIFDGVVWSFTAEPLAYPIEGIVASSNAIYEATAGPENTVNGSGLNADNQHSTEAADMFLGTAGDDPVYLQYEFDQVYKLNEMLVWNYNVQFELLLGFGIKDVTVEYSTDGTNWTALGDVELTQATAKLDYAANTTIDFGGVAAQFVKITVNSGWSTRGQLGLSEVRFMYIPASAREPQPADGTTAVSPSTALAWRAGRDAISHEIYLSTDEQAVVDSSALVDTVTESSYAAGGLDFGSTYFWKVTEVQDAESWEGPVWSFATEEFAAIDGFESYDDEDNVIYETWIDGWVNETGSTVGYLEAPFAERTIVNSGGQSMPLQYDNGVSPFYSEAERDLDGMDLDTNGADSLRLFVSGQAPAFFESTDGSIFMNAIGEDIWNAADQFRYAYKNLTGDGSIIARIDHLDGTPSTWAKGGVMIRQSTEAGAINTCMLMTGGDGGGATYQQRMVADDVSVSQHTYDDGPFAPPYWVRVTREGNTLLGYTSPDGQTWTQRGDTITLAMTDPVLIGLALTSHNAAATTSAEFSNISTTGNVSGTWQIAEIGVAQPTAAGNDLETVYVAVEDSAGQVAVATHPSAALRSGWTEWLIPYTDLAGVNLNSVSMIYVGLGDRDNPTSGGGGTIFIDDIGYGRPAPEPAYENLLANGGFEDGDLAPWNTYGDVVAEVVSSEAIEGGSSLHITVNSAGANFWDSGLQHTGHVFGAGKQYTLSAFVKCSTGTLDINFKPELAADPWSGFGDQVFTMTDEWTEFSVTTPVFAENTSPAAITFHIGFAAADFWIDGVRFYEGEYVAP
jgi:concanavalin A-like lectin/glucanase superfamily protein/carbohydrate binding protein with CBM4/9 domain/F5/8 type C domain-containing protein